MVKANFLSLSILDIEKESGMCFQIHRICKKDWVLYFFERDENLGNLSPLMYLSPLMSEVYRLVNLFSKLYVSLFFSGLLSYLVGMKRIR